MDTCIKVILGTALLIALCLGAKMATGKAGRGRLTSAYGFTVVRSALVPLIMITLAWYLVNPETAVGQSELHLSNEVKLVGLVIFLLGMTVRVWSQFVLGNQWSADLSVRANHQLVQSGPYSWVRHPIYLSYWILTPSLFMITGNLFIAGLVLVYALFSIFRTREEESMLRKNFGATYEAYLERTSALAVLFFTVSIFSIHIFGGIAELRYIFGG